MVYEDGKRRARMQWCLGEILILMRGAAGRILNDWSSTKGKAGQQKA